MAPISGKHKRDKALVFAEPFVRFAAEAVAGMSVAPSMATTKGRSFRRFMGSSTRGCRPVIVVDGGGPRTHLPSVGSSEIRLGDAALGGDAGARMESDTARRAH